MDKTRAGRRGCGNPGSLSVSAIDASVGSKSEEESSVVFIVGGEEEGVGEVEVLSVFQDLVFEVAGGGFHLVGVALGCRDRSRERGRMSSGRRRACRDRRRATEGVVARAGAQAVPTGRTRTGLMAVAGARLRVIARAACTRIGSRDGQSSDRTLVDGVRIRDLGVRWG
jgi:hypothetical protein